MVTPLVKGCTQPLSSDPKIELECYGYLPYITNPVCEESPQVWSLSRLTQMITIKFRVSVGGLLPPKVLKNMTGHMFSVWHGILQEGASALGRSFSLITRWRCGPKVIRVDDEVIAEEVRFWCDDEDQVWWWRKRNKDYLALNGLCYGNKWISGTWM
jgi:hypothetical protein